ncbi:hypothetical protein [Streptomyces sp. NPDC020681]|uniref:hypothetical protein n=1 Tax=Streptomyces sp. NPDC020681 TaxID=3365083 RepID=UPI0037A00E4C
MGIESDQLVYDYLSKVGDLAQQQQLPSGTRMQLVSALRNEIDRQRAKASADSPAAVRRILGRLGTPDEIVASAGGASAPQTPVREPAEPSTGKTALPGQRVRRRIPRPRRSAPDQAGAPSASAGASPPHLAGMDELGASGAQPDWWRVEPKPFGAGESVAGFVGGVEIPEILKPPPVKKDVEDEEEDPYEEEYEDEDAEEEAAGPRRWLPRAGFGNPFLLLAAALLIAGAVLGSWIALGGGWLLAYASRRLSRTEAKWVVAGLPGLVVTGGVVWLWGRINGRWGEPIPEDGMRDVLAGTWPWVVKGAAVASALYLLWRARRR